MIKARPYALIALLASFSLPPVHAAKPDFPETLTIGEETLALQGKSRFRAYRIFKVFDVAIYAQDPVTAFPLRKDNPFALSFHYHRNIPAEALIKTAAKVMEDSHAVDRLRTLSSRIETLNAAYQDVQPGDRYTLTFDPQTGTSLFFNGQQAAVIPGVDFAEVYFSIWLGDHPQSKNLRADLLGR